MRLTAFSDFSLRVLMYAHAHSGRLVTIEETAAAYGVSRAHLMKVVHLLAREGFVRAQRGRSGGFTLARPAAGIRLGEVLRATEGDFALVECFADGNCCAISNHCALPNVLNEALRAFMGVLDGYTLADIALQARSFDGPLPAEPQAVRGPEWEPLPEAASGAEPAAPARPERSAGSPAEALMPLAAGPAPGA